SLSQSLRICILQWIGIKAEQLQSVSKMWLQDLQSEHWNTLLRIRLRDAKLRVSEVNSEVDSEDMPPTAKNWILFCFADGVVENGVFQRLVYPVPDPRQPLVVLGHFEVTESSISWIPLIDPASSKTVLLSCAPKQFLHTYRGANQHDSFGGLWVLYPLMS